MIGSLKVLMAGTLPEDLQSVKGGVESAIINLFYGFRSLPDIEIVHLAFKQGLSAAYTVQFSEKIRVHYIPFKTGIQLLDYFLNRATLKSLIASENPDIIHIQESEPHLLRFIGFPRVNMVVTQHGIMREELRYASGFTRKLKFLFKSIIERHVFPYFKNVIFISHYNQNLYGKSPKRSALIYNAVNPIFFEHRADQKPKPNAIAYIGVINRRKNLKLVLEAMHQLKQQQVHYELHVIGAYKESDLDYKHEIESLVGMYGLHKDVLFHGWLRQQEILQVLDLCTFFVLPSMQETLPVSVAEAMAMGKVVIASDVGATAEMFVSNESGFIFKRNDVEALISILKKLNQMDPAELDQCAQAARIMATAKYDPCRNAAQTADFYRSIINTSNNKD
jgi:glycosyltransferase involved in cell wall biosynthesis